MVARGIRNNNPMNIRKGDNWLGLAEKQDDKDFCVFTHHKFGIRAFCKIILNYNRMYGINSVRCIVDRYAPPSENNTTSYIEHICSYLGVDKDESLKVHNSSVMLKLCKVFIKHECGCIPYTDNEIRQGMSLAGII